MVLRLMRRRSSRLGFGRPVPPARESEERREHAKSVPALLQALLQQQRHEGAGRGDSQADPGENHAADGSAPCRRGVWQNDRSRQHHDDAAGKARQEAPSEKPHERQRCCARNEGERGKQHHRPQRADRTDPGRESSCRERASEITGQVRRAEIDDIRRAEPFRRNQRRDQRRVGKTGEPEADQRCRKARHGVSPG